VRIFAVFETTITGCISSLYSSNRSRSTMWQLFTLEHEYSNCSLTLVFRMNFTQVQAQVCRGCRYSTGV